MKITGVKTNNHKKVFIVETGKQRYEYPFSRLTLRPTPQNPIVRCTVDLEIGAEGFIYELKNGLSDEVHIDQVLAFNKDPGYAREMLLYQLTLKAHEILASGRVSKREVARRLHTSPSQLYRMLDQTNYKKSLDQMVKLISAMDHVVEIKVGKAA